MNHRILYNRVFGLTVALVLVASLAFSAASRKKAEPRRLVTGEEIVNDTPFTGPGYPATYNLGPGDSIGYTTYDYGTNGSANHNLIDYGTSVALIRMAAHDLSAATTDRDSWRKCSVTDGNTWPGAMTKIEVLRRGWSCIFDLGGREGVVSHVALEVNTDATQCANTWTSTLTGNATDTWPRAAVTNGDDLHIIATISTPAPADIFYSRSLDGGATFDMVHVSIATPPLSTGDADAYDIASDGTNLAVVWAGLFGNVALLESADNGATWTSSIIYDTDETGFTEENVPDGSISCVYDNDGDLHVAWGTYYASGEGPDSLFFSTQVGIQHWSAATGVQQIALPPDSLIVFNEIWRDGAVATQPDLAVDADNNIYCVFSSWINEVDVYGNAYEHVIGVASPDNGATWDETVDLTPGTGFDASFPSIADDASDGTVNLVYNCDPYAGNWLQASVGGGLHPHIQVAMMYLNVGVGDFFPLGCDDLTLRIARCISGGFVQARVIVEGTIQAGKEITFQVDEDAYVGVIGTNGVRSRASIQTGALGTGTHTVDVIDPPGCFPSFVVTCATAGKDDPAWDDEWGTEEVVATKVTPIETTLLGNYPNPFNPTTNISYGLNQDGFVTLKIYNTLGEEIATLVNEFQPAGIKSATWDGRNGAGVPVASGIYIYRLKTGNVVKSEKMMFMK